jgi:hypothetical protein
VTAKIGGSNRPWTNRQKMSCGTLAAKVMISIGTTAANMAVVIRRLRPATSASAPVNGADNAIAAVPAVISALISPAPTLNSRANSGSSACGE